DVLHANLQDDPDALGFRRVAERTPFDGRFARHPGNRELPGAARHGLADGGGGFPAPGRARSLPVGSRLAVRTLRGRGASDESEGDRHGQPCSPWEPVTPRSPHWSYLRSVSPRPIVKP